MARPNYPLNPAHVYDPNVPQILDTDPVRASTSINPLATQIINNVEVLNRKISTLSGFTISIIVPTLADLPDPSEVDEGKIYLVREDETHDGQATMWEVIAGEWAFLGLFGFDVSELWEAVPRTIPFTLPAASWIASSAHPGLAVEQRLGFTGLAEYGMVLVSFNEAAVTIMEQLGGGRADEDLASEQLVFYLASEPDVDLTGKYALIRRMD